jgi:tetratricopeptide (TPR) repeat protein
MTNKFIAQNNIKNTLKKAITLKRNEEYSESIESYKKLLFHSDINLDTIEKIKCYINISDCYIKLELCDSARYYLTKLKLLQGKYLSLNIKYQFIFNLCYAKLKFCEGNYKGYIEDTENLLNQDNFNTINEYLKFDIFKNLAFSHLYLNNTLESNRYLERVLKHLNSKKGSSNQKLINLHFNIGLISLDVGKYHKALSHFNWIKNHLQKKRNLNHQLLSMVDYNICMCHFRLGDIETAIEYINKKTGKDINKLYHEDNIDHLIILGYYNFLKGYYQEALRCFKNVIKKSKAISENQINILSYSYSIVGTLHYLGANYNMALSYYEQAFQIIQKLPNERYVMANKSYYHTLFGNAYYKLGKLEKSVFHYNIALNSTKYINHLYIDYEIICYINLGLIYYKQDLLKKAKEFYFKALEKLEIMNECENYMPFIIPQIYQHFIELTIKLGDHKNTQKYTKKALHFISTKEYIDNFSLTRLFKLIGEIHELNNSLDSALVYYQKAISYAINDFDEIDVRKNPSIEIMPFDVNLIESLESKARALQKYYAKSADFSDLDAALNTYIVAIDFLDKMRCRVRTEKNKMRIGEEHQNIFTDALKIAYKMYLMSSDFQYAESAFKIVEKNKASALRLYLNDSNAKISAGIPDSLLDKEEEIKEKWSKFNHLLYEMENRTQMFDSKELKYYQTKVFEISQEYDFLIDYFESQYEDYYKYKYNTSSVTLKEIQSKQTDASAFIEYSLVDSALFVFAVSKDTIVFNKISLESSFDTLVSNFCSSIADRSFDRYVINAYQLYEILLAPFEFIKREKNLVIIPDNILGYLAFEALLTNKVNPGGFDYRNLPYVLNLYKITYDYSATLYYGLQDNRLKGLTKMNYGFAPIKY